MTEELYPSTPETQDEAYFEREETPKERWELVEEKANELLADVDWVQDTLLRFNLFDDVSSWLRGDDDVMWKVRRMVQNYAKSKAEELI